ncbi:MAG: hypothetical protein MMC33_004268, partial [Icmadophila ericetorum]|nr:hypothetical protein [Icmadophila ericetorum]
MDAPDGTTFLGKEELGSILYVREAYLALYEQMEAERRKGFAHAVISGTPGVGKPWFALYVL